MSIIKNPSIIPTHDYRKEMPKGKGSKRVRDKQKGKGEKERDRERSRERQREENKTKSIGVSEANYSCIWFLNSGIINSYQQC